MRASGDTINHDSKPMKTKFTIALFLLVAAAACSSIQEEPVNTDGTLGKSEAVFYATLEQGGEADVTKVYAGDNLKVLWNADDRISIYNKYTYGFEYAFQGASGETTGVFAKVEDDAEFVVGNKLDNIYALYPYRDDNRISDTGELSITWPSSQTYKPDSFGMGANVMVSVTTNNQLCFKNVGGYLALKLYGNNVSVSSITLRGNNGEKLSGRTAVTCELDEEPKITFQSSASEILRLECTSPVHIGNTAESATTFWLVVPPTEFTEGFNITVLTSNGLVFFKSTDLEYEIERNTLTRMAAVEVIPSNIVPFVDANFKAYCVENFDADNDEEISLSEALSVTSILLNTDNITSVQGLEFFENLRSLSCRGSLNSDYGCGNGRLTSLDVSNNTALTSLTCSYNRLLNLDVSHNTALTSLTCSYNRLSNLDVSHNTALTELNCWHNLLTSLDVTNNTALTVLDCGENQLTSLDVSNNTALTSLDCGGNQLTSLDVSNNTALTSLNCYINQLTSLDLSNNAVLNYVFCYSNQLTSLDVSNSTLLVTLDSHRNQLTSLDVSHNTALTYLSCYANQLSFLDVTNNTALSALWCHVNQLTSLDVSNNTVLTDLQCNSNPYLTDIWFNTGQTIENFSYDINVAQIHYKD